VSRPSRRRGTAGPAAIGTPSVLASAALRPGSSPQASPARTSAARWVQIGLVILVAVMPFHAFLSVWLGHLTGHEAIWQSWKELLLLVLAGFSVEVVRREPARLLRWRNPLVYATMAFVIIGLVVSLVHRGSLTSTAFGLKTDAEFLLAMLLGLLVADARLVERLRPVAIISSGLVIGFGLLQIYLLPINWLSHFGYGASTIEPFLRVDPAIPAIRVLSTLGGPNQLGSFLIVPLCLVGWALLTKPRWWQPIYLAGGLIVLWHTYSRSALLGAAVAVVVLLVLRVRRSWRLPLLLIAVILAAVAIQATTIGVSRDKTLQYYVFHETLQDTGIAASTDEHSLATKHGLQVVEHHPLGLGLGSAGPASFHSANPLIPENYYLQIAIETGVIGLVGFLMVELLLGWQLAQIGLDRHGPSRALAAPLLAALVGVSIVNFFLQGWADSSTALIFWSLAGATVGAQL